MARLELKTPAKNYVRYEYQEQTVNGHMLALYSDSYPSFGWEIEGKSRPLAGVNRYTLMLKRNRHMANRTELTRLQRQLDSYVKDIENMENAKVLVAASIAYSVGLVGTAFMAGAVFAYIGGFRPLCILLAIPGSICWIVSYLCYMAVGKRKAVQTQPFIEQKYEDICGICERAHALLP